MHLLMGGQILLMVRQLTLMMGAMMVVFQVVFICSYSVDMTNQFLPCTVICTVKNTYKV